MQILANADGFRASLLRQIDPGLQAMNRSVAATATKAAADLDGIADAAAGAIAGAAGEIGDGFDDAFDGIAKDAGKLGEKVGQDLADGIGRASKGIVAEAGQTARKVEGEFAGTGQRIGDEIGRAPIGDGVVGDARRLAGRVVDAFRGSGEEIGEEIGDGIETGIGKVDIGGLVKKALAAGGALAIGASIAGAIGNAIGQEAVTDRLAASLALSPETAEALGRSAGSLYANAYGESFEEVADVLRTAFVVAPDLDSAAVEKLTGQALSLQSAFGGAAGEYLQLGDQLRNQGVVESVTEGLDFITSSFQQLPAEMQDPLLDAVREYGTFMSTLGFTTEEVFGTLSQAALKGEFQLDKVGDSLKEFVTLSTDGSTRTQGAYDAIGLSMSEMTNRILAGGGSAKGALSEIVDGLLAIEDPGQRAEQAIALFGSPLEDLNVAEIPEFLQNLKAMQQGFENVDGSAARLDSTINDNFKTNFTTFTRTASQAFTGFADAFLGPILSDINPALQQLSAWMQEEGPAAAERLQATVGPAFDGIAERLGDVDWGAVFEQIADAAAELGPALANVGSALGGAGFATFTALAPVAVALAPAVAAVADSFAALIANTPQPVLEGIVLAIAGIVAVSKARAIAGQVTLIGKVITQLKAWNLAEKALMLTQKLRGALTAAGGLLTWIRSINLATVATKAWAVAQKLLNLAFLTNPIFLAAAAIAALVAGLVIAYQRSERFRETVAGLGEALKPLLDALKTIGGAFVDLFKGDFGGFLDGIKEGFSGLGAALADLGGQAVRLLWDAIRAGLDQLGLGGVADWLSGPLVDGLRSAFDVAVDVVTVAWDVIRDVVDAGIRVVGAIIGGIRALWDAGVFRVVFDAYVAYARFVWAVISAVVKAGIETVGAIIAGIVAVWDTGVLQTVFGRWVDWLQFVWGAISAVVAGGIAVVGGLIGGIMTVWNTGVLQAIFDRLASAFGAAWQLASDAVSGAINFIGGVIDDAKAVWATIGVAFDVAASVISVAWATISDTTTTAIQVVVGFVRDQLVAPVVERFTVMRDFVTGAARDLWWAVVDRFAVMRATIVDVATNARDRVVGAFDGLRASVEGIAGRIRDAITGPFTTVREFLSGFFDRIGLGSISVAAALRPLQSVIDKINGLIDTVNKLPGLNIPRLPSVPAAASAARTIISGAIRRFAEGGLATEPSVFGEDGDELALPLTKPGRMRTLLSRYSSEIAASVGGTAALVNLLAAGPARTITASLAGPAPILLDRPTQPASSSPTPTGDGTGVRDAITALRDAVEVLARVADQPRTVNHNTINVDPHHNLWDRMALIDQ